MKRNLNIINYSWLLFLLLFQVFPSHLSAGRQDIVFDQLSLDEGLSQVTIKCILQDSRGFMWFGTQDGLNKFDGYKFTAYLPEDDNPHSIGSIFINTLYEDRDGYIWVGTNDGLSRFDRKTETFTRFNYNPGDPHSLSAKGVSSIYQDGDGVLWVGTFYGLNRFDKQTGTFTRFLPNPKNRDSLKGEAVSAFFEDRSGRFWMGTFNGWLHRMDRSSGRFSGIKIPSPPASKMANLPIRVIFEDQSGLIWVVSEGGGLLALNPETGKWEQHYYHTPDNVFSPRSNLFTSFLKSSRNRWWFGTAGGGLNKFDPKDGSFHHLRQSPQDPGSLKDDIILSLYEDRSGMIWVGTQSSGIQRFQCQRLKFTHYKQDIHSKESLSSNVIRSFAETPDGSLWVGTFENGLNRYNPSRQSVRHYFHSPTDPYGLSSNSIRTLYVDSHDTLWVGTAGGGLSRYSLETDTFEHFRHDPGNPDSLSHDYVLAIQETRDGGFWIGTYGGSLNKMDRAKKTFQLFQDKRKNDPHAITNNWILSMHEGSRGTLWLGTTVGLTRFYREKKTFLCYCGDKNSPKGLKQYLVSSIHEDNNGILWIATGGGGLVRFDHDTGHFRTYKKKDGLPNNVIYGILGDAGNNLWISSNKGLSRLDTGTGDIRNYDVYDGLQSNEFNGGAFYKNKKGEMFFGGVNGFNAFFPENVKDNPYMPQVEITGFNIFNKPVPISTRGDSPLRRSISETEFIEISSRQNMFSFDFVSLNYLNTHKNRYTYKMEGFDKDWIQAGTRRFASYTNLGPGEYVFRVKGSNNDGIWNEKGASVKVIIRPTFWQSQWAYVIYAGLFFLVLILVRRFELSRERARVRIRESELRAKAAEAQARALESEHLRKTHELEEARKLQLSMLPGELPETEGLDIAAHMETATEVGGDYYDFHIDDDGTLAVAVGDATGHGLKAGTMVSVIKGLFCAESSHKDIAGFFSRCTHTIKHMRLGNLYMALTLLNIKDNRVNVSSAGMPPLYLHRAQSGELETITLKTAPLGAFSDSLYRFKFKEFKIETGDTILIMSDGLPELFNKSGDMFGYRRVGEVFKEICDHTENAAEIIRQLEQTGREWLQGKPAEDDITFVVIRGK